MCQYKPCVLWFHLNTVLTIVMVGFLLLMWLYTGDYYPGYRFEIGWYWSLIQYLFTSSITIMCAIMLYKEIPDKSLNHFCLCSLIGCATSSVMLSILIWPHLTKTEFENYVFKQYTYDQTVPRFMQYFQSKQQCCGVSNYTDYINLLGTKTIERTIRHESQGLSNKINNAKLKVVVFEVPRSCCQSARQKNRTCGEEISFKDKAEIKRKLNSDRVGCFAKFKEIIYSDSPYQITVIHSIFRAIPLFEIFSMAGLIGIYWLYYSKQINRVGQAGSGFNTRLTKNV